MAHEKKAPVVHRAAAPTGAKPANRTGAQKYPTAEQKAALPSIARTTPVVKPPSSRVVDVPEKLESESFTAEADAEMVVSRFGGKVVEVVGKDIEIPVYRVFSAAQKSLGQRAMVQYLPETENHAPEKPVPVKMKEPPVQKSLDKKAGADLTDRIEQEVTVPAVVVTPTKKIIAATESPDTKAKTVAEKRVEQPVAAPEPMVVAVVKNSSTTPEPVKEKRGDESMKRVEKETFPPVAERVTNMKKKVVVGEKPVQLRQSSSMAKPVSETLSPVHDPGVTPREQLRVAAVPLLSPKNPTEVDRPATRSVLRETVHQQRPEVSVPPLEKRPVERQEQVMPKADPVIRKSSPVVEPKPKPVLGKPSPAQPEKPRAIFLPPLAGDLKIVVTGKEDIKVEAVFREFRKARRSRPMTRGEALNKRSIPLKRARTNLNVHEAVIEIAEEGVYDLTIRSADGKPVTASFVLKMHESGKGAVTKNLGRRTLPDGALLARILMPEGLLWDDESYFTGTMEDSDSITRFHTETGLVWREFR
jgi:hypothetical protein